MLLSAVSRRCSHMFCTDLVFNRKGLMRLPIVALAVIEPQWQANNVVQPCRISRHSISKVMS